MAGFNFNPQPTTVGQGLFTGKSSTGLVQGTAYPDPAVRFQLRGGLISTTETNPMWGGMGIYQDIPGGQGNPNVALGPIVGRATAMTGSKPLAGFSVFDQAYGMINWPQSPVPTALPGMQLMSYRLGSGARVALACDPILVDLRGDPISSQVSWDFVNQMIIPYEAATAISSGEYDPVTGLVTLTTASAHGLGVGDSVVVSGVTGTGADLALTDGTFNTLTGTTGSTIVYSVGVGHTITSITGGSTTTGAPLSVSILDIQATNCMTVHYDSTSGNTTWNYNGSAVLLQI